MDKPPVNTKRDLMLYCPFQEGDNTPFELVLCKVNALGNAGDIIRKFVDTFYALEYAAQEWPYSTVWDWEQYVIAYPQEEESECESD